MGKITIYHNNRCSKSRCALELIEKRTKDIEIVEYLTSPPSENELKIILRKLGVKAEDIVRRKEPIFKEKFEGKKFTEAQWIKVLCKNPILIERPIVVRGNKAVIGRPTENLNQIL